MNKAGLAAHTAANAPTTRAAADRLVGAVFSTTADTLAPGESEPIAGFGRIATRSRPARTARNSQTGDPVAIAASNVPSFNERRARQHVLER